MNLLNLGNAKKLLKSVGGNLTENVSGVAEGLGKATLGKASGIVTDTLKGSVGDTLKGVVGDNLKGSVGDTLKGVVGDTLKGVVGDTLKGVVGDNLKGSVGDTLKGAVGDTLKGAVGDTLKGVGDNLKGVVGDTLKGAVGDTFEGIVGDTSHGTMDVVDTLETNIQSTISSAGNSLKEFVGEPVKSHKIYGFGDLQDDVKYVVNEIDMITGDPDRGVELISERLTIWKKILLNTNRYGIIAAILLVGLCMLYKFYTLPKVAVVIDVHTSPDVDIATIEKPTLPSAPCGTLPSLLSAYVTTPLAAIYDRDVVQMATTRPDHFYQTHVTSMDRNMVNRLVDPHNGLGIKSISGFSHYAFSAKTLFICVVFVCLLVTLPYWGEWRPKIVLFCFRLGVLGIFTYSLACI